MPSVEEPPEPPPPCNLWPPETIAAYLTQHRVLERVNLMAQRVNRLKERLGE